MIIFKVALVILVSAPAIIAAAFLFVKARGFAGKLNREDRARELAGGEKQYRGYIDE